MERERWRRMRQLFDGALDLEAAGWESYLTAACGDDPVLAAEVLALLRADSDAAQTPLVDSEPLEYLRAVDLSGGAIAGFRIRRQIGAGGMGTVYEAEQQRPHRSVALKTLAVRFPSERARRRFEDEADILARLRHPAIANVLDAGTWRTGGLEVPWFAMELVEEPRPIDRWVHEQGLDARAIAKLFQTVCAAVHFAHQHGVIHRDLKPANLLVDRHGQVKIIDFGIARVVDQAGGSGGGPGTPRPTLTGEVLGTLAYMPPERLERRCDADDDTAADVYALGVILYELLAQRTPFPIDGLPPAQAIDVLRASEPPPPSRAAPARRISPELDWITMRAMAHERSERYASVAELGQDLGRCLRDEPVHASPPSKTYRLRKLARRHRVALVAAIVMIAGISTSAVVAALGWRRATLAEQRARAEANAMAEVTRFQDRILRGAYGSDRGRDVRLADVIHAAARDLENTPFADTYVEVGARTSIATSLLGLGEFDEAVRHLLEARARLTEDGIDRHGRWGILVSETLALAYQDAGKLQLAEGEARAALVDRLAIDGPDAVATAISQSNLVGILNKTGAFGEAFELAEQALRTFAHVHGDGAAPTINARAQLAQAHARLGHDDEAERTYALALAQAEQHLHQDHPVRLAVGSAAGGHMFQRRRFAQAAALLGQVTAARERLLGPSHPETLAAWSNLAAAQAELGDLVGAEKTLRRVVAGFEAAGLDTGYPGIMAHQSLTSVVRRQGRPSDAEPMAVANRAAAARSLPAGHWLIGVTTKEHGACLRELGRMTEAESALLTAVQVLDAAVGASDSRTAKVVEELIALYEAWQRPEEAARWRARQQN